VNGWIPTPSERQAAWILGGAPYTPPAGAPDLLSAGEEERLELVEVLAARLQTGDAAEVAVCRRLLQHLQGPEVHRTIASRLQ
jgi:hypothetical protein